MSDNNQIDNLSFKAYTKVIPKTEKSFKYWYLGDYIPKARQFRGVTQDNFSKTIINLKNGDSDAISFFLKKLKIFLSQELNVKNALFINAPTSKKSETNSVSKIIDLLCNEEKNYTNCSNYLCRSKDVTPSHKLRKSEREDFNMHKDSMFLKNRDNCRNQNIILIDDVITTCATLFACKEIILESYPRENWDLNGFSCVVFGRTIDID